MRVPGIPKEIITAALRTNQLILDLMEFIGDPSEERTFLI
jgi:hypothetical protein